MTFSAVLAGVLLGDGGLERRDRPAPRLRVTNKHRSYLELVAEHLADEGIPSRIGPTSSGHWTLWTRGMPSLADVVLDWYPVAGKKRSVPDLLDLAPMALLHWWLGDGGLAKRLDKRPTGYLYTNSFAPDVVHRLASSLTEIGISASAQRCGGLQRHEWRIHLPRAGVVAMVDKIGPPPVAEYAYKWNVDLIHRPGSDEEVSARRATARAALQAWRAGMPEEKRAEYRARNAEYMRHHRDGRMAKLKVRDL